MDGNSIFAFDDVGVLSLAAPEAPEVVSTDDVDRRLAPFYERTGATPGQLRTLAGIHSRRQWPAEVSFMDAAALAGRQALAESGVDPSRIGLMVDTSVCRERLEPSSAVTVHDQLGLPSTCMNFDLSNACLGFLNGMHLAGTMIEAGQIDLALVVDGEGTREIYDNTISALNGSEANMEDLFANFASLTLGSGCAAMVLGRHSEHPGSHRIKRGFFRAATEHHELCVGSLDGMRTDTRGLLDAGIHLVKVAWDAYDTTGWEDADRYVLHQVSRVHTAAMVEMLQLDPERIPLTFPTRGNIGPAAIPVTLASIQHELSPGDTVLCLGVGSGLNVGMLELEW